MAESLMQYGVVKDPVKITQILSGSPIETTFDEQWSERVAVQQEIENFNSGKQVMPFQTDNHPLYIQQYAKLLSDPNFRLESQKHANLLEILRMRVEMELSLDPNIKALLRNQPLPQGEQFSQPQMSEVNKGERASANGDTVTEPSQEAEPLNEGV
jgi:hypothetical protein